MRRPLFGNGIPQFTNGAAPVLVFDTTAQDPPNEQHIYALTLFFWRNLDEAVGTGVTVYVVTNGGPPVAYNILPVAGGALASRRVTPNGTYLIVDQLVLRGNQQVYFATPPPPSVAMAGWLYGYFEMDGFTPNSLNIRPLQPTNTLVSPFNAPLPAVSLLAGAAPQAVVAHELSPDYIDILSMNLSAAVGGAEVAFAKVILPGVVATPANGGGMTFLAINGVLSNEALFPGIPMRAPNNNDVDISLELTVGVNFPAAASLLGHFSRG